MISGINLSHYPSPNTQPTSIHPAPLPPLFQQRRLNKSPVLSEKNTDHRSLLPNFKFTVETTSPSTFDILLGTRSEDAQNIFINVNEVPYGFKSPTLRKPKANLTLHIALALAHRVSSSSLESPQDHPEKSLAGKLFFDSELDGNENAYGGMWNATSVCGLCMYEQERCMDVIHGGKSIKAF